VTTPARTILAALLALAGCKEKEKAATAPTASAPAPVAVAADAAPPARPAMPPLGPPPAGMDPAKAAACDNGDPAACFAAAEQISPKGAYRANMKPEEADALERDTVRYAQRACDLDNADGCELAGRFHKFNSAEARAALGRACDLGKLGACGDLAQYMLMNGSDPAGRPRGVELLEKACRGNGVGVQGEAGEFCESAASLFQGKGDDKPFKDLAKAAELKTLSCEQGRKLGCPCKEDPDCGGGDYFCLDDQCELPSPD
jgi:hypothetical protein